MGTLERRVTIAHEIGPTGRLSIKAVTGVLRLRGVDGGEARVHVTYHVQAPDQAAAERALEAGQVTVDRGPGWLGIETSERRLSTGLNWIFGGSRVKADMDVEAPRGAEVRVETISGSIDVVGLAGEQRYRTISGDHYLRGVAGPVDAESVSGTVTVDDAGELGLRARTVSGSIRARATRFRMLRLSTTSGGITVVGQLAPDGEHRAESVSGSLELSTPSGVTAELKSLSGSIRSEVEHRLDGGRGSWRAIVGDGLSRLRFSSTSGQLRILASSIATRAPGMPGAGPSPQAQPAPEAPAGTPPAATDGPSGPGPAEDAPAEGSADAWLPETAPDAPAEPATAEREDELAVLRALERGEIGVEEAADRLERARR